MNKDKALTILNSAMLLEKRGEAFYRKVGEQSEVSEVKEFFLDMAEDERNHVAVLKGQLDHYLENKSFNTEVAKDALGKVADEVLNPKLKDLIEGASYEAAAVAAAINMEKTATDLYSQRATAATDDEEKKLYKWLSTWEQSHLDELIRLDEAIREKYWYDNSFAPM